MWEIRRGGESSKYILIEQYRRNPKFNDPYFEGRGVKQVCHVEY